MVEPAHQDLYVMQNEFGLIKIGRSVDADARRKLLQSQEQCRIELIAVLPGWGDQEERVHIALRDYHLMGEWFHGHREARAAILAAVDLPSETLWRYSINHKAARQWIEQLERWREDRKLDKEFGREIATLARADGPHYTHDISIWMLVYRGELRLPWRMTFRDLNGAKVRMVDKLDGMPEAPIPSFTSDITAALMIWSDEDRPAIWEGSALQCCVAGLKARKRRLRRRDHRNHVIEEEV
jgi:hypothetical protein